MQAPVNPTFPPPPADAAARAVAASLGIDPAVEWQMQPAEQFTLGYFAQNLRPSVAVEIGSKYGGSLQVLARHAARVISLDIDPTCPARLGPRFPSAEFVTGRSQETFGPLLDRLSAEGAELGLVLIDGDHTAAGVAADIGPLLAYRPRCPVYVFLHDSFNPPVREGILRAAWADSQFVHAVELDYVPGVFQRCPGADREMWGGLALAVLLPEPRRHELTVSARHEPMFAALKMHSAHTLWNPRTFRDRAVRKVRHLLGRRK